jgi:tubulin polyglutamylase TTLL9
VNASPSLTVSGYNDYILKYNLLQDVLNIIDLEKRFTGEKKQMGGFDLICKGEPNFETKSTLGINFIFFRKFD